MKKSDKVAEERIEETLKKLPASEVLEVMNNVKAGMNRKQRRAFETRLKHRRRVTAKLAG